MLTWEFLFEFLGNTDDTDKTRIFTDTISKLVTSKSWSSYEVSSCPDH
jgi:hypothetical protein